MVLDHILDRQGLETNRLVLTDQSGRQLVVKITAGIGDASMQLGNFEAGFRSVLAPLLFLGKSSLCLGKLLFITSIVFGVGYRLPIRGDEEGFQTQVNAHCFLSWGKRRDGFLNQDRDKVATSFVSGDGDTTWFCSIR